MIETCARCGRPILNPIDHEFCQKEPEPEEDDSDDYLYHDNPKTYTEYLTESVSRIKHMVKKYGASKDAKPPSVLHKNSTLHGRKRMVNRKPWN